jgi:predicted HNH restriction endonuclease
MRGLTVIKFIVFAALIAACGIGGCSKAPNKDDQSKLEEAKTATEGAEKKLYDTRQERMRLEAEKGQKKSDDKENK